MGKKLCRQDSVKPSKLSNSSSNCSSGGNRTYNLNSLIKILKPKVYITDSTTFKTLVQELTGNGNDNNGLISISPTSISTPSATHHHQPLDYAYGFQESSPELSFDYSEVTTFSDINPSTYDQLQLNEPTQALISSSSSDDDDELHNCTWFNDQYDYNKSTFLQYNTAETESPASSLLEMVTDDPFLYNYHDDTAYGIPIMPYLEVCVYDYDLSGIV